MSLPTQKNVFQSINDHALLKSIKISEVISALTDFFFSSSSIFLKCINKHISSFELQPELIVNQLKHFYFHVYGLIKALIVFGQSY